MKSGISSVPFLFLSLALIFPAPASGQVSMGFIRGDSNCDKGIDVCDAILDLTHLYLGQEVNCLDAADFNASGDIGITDVVGVLQFLFLDGSPPEEPFPECGLTQGGGSLGCAQASCEIKTDADEKVWMGMHEGCYQCEPCSAPPLPEVVKDLEAKGIEVFDSKVIGVIVIALCGAPTGRIYCILVSAEDVPALEKMGWRSSSDFPLAF